MEWKERLTMSPREKSTFEWFYAYEKLTPGRQISYFVLSRVPAARRFTKRSTITIGREPHAFIAIETHATDFSWSTWLATLIAGASAKHGGHTQANTK